jgi:hypothetical protein
MEARLWTAEQLFRGKCKAHERTDEFCERFLDDLYAIPYLPLIDFVSMNLVERESERSQEILTNFTPNAWIRIEHTMASSIIHPAIKEQQMMFPMSSKEGLSSI